jgi:hypothetical protein
MIFAWTSNFHLHLQQNREMFFLLVSDRPLYLSLSLSLFFGLPNFSFPGCPPFFSYLLAAAAYHFIALMPQVIEGRVLFREVRRLVPHGVGGHPKAEER